MLEQCHTAERSYLTALLPASVVLVHLLAFLIAVAAIEVGQAPNLATWCRSPSRPPCPACAWMSRASASVAGLTVSEAE